MKYYEKSIVESICRLFVKWNGWGPPTSDYQIIEFCQAKAASELESEQYIDILSRWMSGDYDFKNPLWIRDD